MLIIGDETLIIIMEQIQKDNLWNAIIRYLQKQKKSSWQKGDTQGVILVDFMLRGETVNSEACIVTLKESESTE